MQVKEKAVPVNNDVSQEESHCEEETQNDEVSPQIPGIANEEVPQENDSNPQKVVRKRNRPKAKAEPKPDLSQRMSCAICKKMYTLHSLLYRHTSRGG